MVLIRVKRNYIYIYLNFVIVIIAGEGEGINTVEVPKLFYIYCDVGERKKRNLSPPKCNLGRRIPSVEIIPLWNMHSWREGPMQV